MLVLKPRNSYRELEKFLMPLFLLVLFVLAYYHIAFLESAPGKMLQKTLQNMEQNFANLEIRIVEQGTGYTLNFQGNLDHNATIYGKISDYKLDICKHSSGELFIKDLKDGVWKKAAALGLESLQDFLSSPLELLFSWSHLFKGAKFARFSGGEEKVVTFLVPPVEQAKTVLWVDTMPQPMSMECVVFIEPEKLFIKQVVLSFYDQQRAEKVLSRTFFIKSTETNSPVATPCTI